MQTLASQLSSTLMQLLSSFDQDMRVEKTLIQILASQLLSTLMQLLSSFDQDMRVEKTLIQTLASQLLSTLMQLLWENSHWYKLSLVISHQLQCDIQTLASQLSSTFMQLLFLFVQDMRVVKTLIQSFTCNLSSAPMWLPFDDLNVNQSSSHIMQLTHGCCRNDHIFSISFPIPTSPSMFDQAPGSC